jgi:hypothetical protein
MNAALGARREWKSLSLIQPAATPPAMPVMQPQKPQLNVMCSTPS